MSHGTEHHLEEAEHIQHHAADPFTMRVAMSMAIIAACLAFVSMLSHRKHNEVITQQIESTSKFTEASNTWSQYQAKRIRANMLKALADSQIATKSKPSEKKPDPIQAYIDSSLQKINEYENGDPNWKKKQERQAEARSSAEEGKDEASQDPDSLPNLQRKARELTKESDDCRKKAEVAHHQANYLDSGHLGLELGLVLCSIAVLTKRKMFWYTGTAVGAMGFVASMLAFLPH